MGFVVIFIVGMIYIALKAGAREISNLERQKENKKFAQEQERNKKK